MRGEDPCGGLRVPLVIETPPRAWGRPRYNHECLLSSRNTPTCVGKTLQLRAVFLLPEKHPHVRGEDAGAGAAATRTSETPPRAWGRPRWSTRPENGCWKHPHVRGEDQGLHSFRVHIMETPPRAWGRPRILRPLNLRVKKQPHVRGEDRPASFTAVARCETPPRAWGRRSRPPRAGRAGRNTPTCVGKTQSC